MTEGMGFVLEEGTIVLSFSLEWTEEAPESDDERRLAVLQALDALYHEIEAPWRETSGCETHHLTRAAA